MVHSVSLTADLFLYLVDKCLALLACLARASGPLLRCMLALCFSSGPQEPHGRSRISICHLID